MKFFSVALLAFAAMVQADPIPNPEPGIIGDIISSAVSKVTSFVGDVHSNWDEGISRGKSLNSANSQIDEIFRTNPSKVIASLTSEAGPKFSSLSSVAATATGDAASSASSEISRLSESLASATSSAAKAASTAKKDHAPAPTAFVAMGALMGGAAVLANL